jgi:DNA-binding response OmpR family regulator
MRTGFEPSHTAETDRIFVVESDEVVRSALQFILDSRGEVSGFANLSRAIAEAPEPTPDIVLLGIGFLQADGDRVLAEIALYWPGTRILIVADSVNDRLACASLKWGAHDVLGKPITFKGVRGKVDALLGEHKMSPDMLALLPLSAAW